MLSARLVFPIPGSPTSIKSRPRPLAAPSSAPVASPISRSRPTSGPRPSVVMTDANADAGSRARTPAASLSGLRRSRSGLPPAAHAGAVKFDDSDRADPSEVEDRRGSRFPGGRAGAGVGGLGLVGGVIYLVLRVMADNGSPTAGQLTRAIEEAQQNPGARTEPGAEATAREPLGELPRRRRPERSGQVHRLRREQRAGVLAAQAGAVGRADL